MKFHSFVIGDIPAELKGKMLRAIRLDFDKTDHAGLVSELLQTDWSHTFSTN